jgi:hypothetical protein
MLFLLFLSFPSFFSFSFGFVFAIRAPFLALLPFPLKQKQQKQISAKSGQAKAAGAERGENFRLNPSRLFSPRNRGDTDRKENTKMGPY